METLVGELHFELEKSKLYSFKLNIELSNINFSNFNFQLKIKMGSVSLRYRFVVGLKKWFASIFSWFASAVYWVESAHSCSVTFFECHYDTNDYWGTGCGYLKKIIFASFKNGNICYQMIEFILLRILFKLIVRKYAFSVNQRLLDIFPENSDSSNFKFFSWKPTFSAN